MHVDISYIYICIYICMDDIFLNIVKIAIVLFARVHARVCKKRMSLQTNVAANECRCK